MSARVISSRAANGSSISSSGAPSAIALTSADALLHPTGQLVRVGVGELGPDRHRASSSVTAGPLVAA